MKFLKKSEITLVNGGYLSASKDESPVNHDGFVQAQNKAHYLVTLAANLVGKNFKATKVDNFQDVVEQTVKAINAANTVKYATDPTKPETPLKDQLAGEAMAWINFDKSTSVANQVNKAMQEFNILKDFEDNGLFFNEGIVRLNRIYTIAEIQAAVESIQPHLNS
jgi:hypothetical protein